MPKDNPIQRFRSNWQDEVDSASQYHAMAMSETDEAIAHVYRELGTVEEKHAAFWEDQLRKAGIEVGPRKPSWRSRVLSWIARRFGAQLILPTVATSEYKNRNDYLHQPESAGTRMTPALRSRGDYSGGAILCSPWSGPLASIGTSSLVLFGLGAAITIFTGRPAWISGFRQLSLGLAAAGITFALGRAFGVALG